MTRHVCRIVWLAAAAALATGLAACGDDDDLPPPASPGANGGPPGSTLDPEHQEILDVYRASVDAMVAAQQAGDADHPDLTRYFLERTPAYNGLLNTINNNDRRGMYYTGELVVVNAQVAELTPDADPPSATIESCLDYTDYQLVHREDDSPVAEAEPVGRVTVTAEAVQNTDGRWYILTNTPHWDEEC